MQAVSRSALQRTATLMLICLLVATGLGCQASINARPKQPAPPPPPPVWQETVTAYELNVRSGPGPKFSGVNVLHRGEMVEILGREGNWIQIRNPRVPFGWVYGAYLTGFGDIPIPKKQSPEEMEIRAVPMGDKPIIPPQQ